VKEQCIKAYERRKSRISMQNWHRNQEETKKNQVESSQNQWKREDEKAWWTSINDGNTK